MAQIKPNSILIPPPCPFPLPSRLSILQEYWCRHRRQHARWRFPRHLCHNLARALLRAVRLVLRIRQHNLLHFRRPQYKTRTSQKREVRRRNLLARLGLDKVSTMLRYEPYGACERRRNGKCRDRGWVHSFARALALALVLILVLVLALTLALVAL